jgi:hypothetical protein
MKVNPKNRSHDTWLYGILAVFIVLVVVGAVVISGRSFTPAYIPDKILGSTWTEDLSRRQSGEQLLGLERWSSVTYRVEGRYPAYLTVTTIKTLVMLNEEFLQEKTMETLEGAIKDGIEINLSSAVSGERTIQSGFTTRYTIYNGTDTSTMPPEQVKLIGEVWTSGLAGTAVICIGYAQISDFAHNSSTLHSEWWSNIIRDEQGTFGDAFQGADGLIDNVVCS